MRITSAPETSDRAMQPKTTLPSPQVSKKRTLKVVFFTSIILPVCGTPWEPTSIQISGGPLMWRPQPMVKDIEGHPIFALGAPNPEKTPACRSTAPHPWSPPPPQRPLGCRCCVHGPRGSGLVDRSDRPLVSYRIPSNRSSASTTSPEPLPPRYQPRGRSRRAVTV